MSLFSTWPLGASSVAPLWIDLAPERACEVLSPETAARDRGDKRIVSAKAGVRHLRLAEPAQRTLEVFELRDGKWKLLESFRDNAKVVTPPFFNLSVPLTRYGRLTIGRLRSPGAATPEPKERCCD